MFVYRKAPTLSDKEYARVRHRVHFLRKLYVVIAVLNMLVDITVLAVLGLSLRGSDGFACCSTCGVGAFQSAATPKTLTLLRVNGTCVAVDPQSSTADALEGACPGYGNRVSCAGAELCSPSALSNAYNRAVSTIVYIIIGKLFTLLVSLASLAATTMRPLKPGSKRKKMVRFLIYAMALLGLILSILIIVNDVQKDFQEPTCANLYKKGQESACKAAKSECGLNVILVISSRGLIFPAIVSLITAIVAVVLLALRHLLCRKKMAPLYAETKVVRNTDDFDSVTPHPTPSVKYPGGPPIDSAERRARSSSRAKPRAHAAIPLDTLDDNSPRPAPEFGPGAAAKKSKAKSKAKKSKAKKKGKRRKTDAQLAMGMGTYEPRRPPPAYAFSNTEAVVPGNPYATPSPEMMQLYASGLSDPPPSGRLVGGPSPYLPPHVGYWVCHQCTLQNDFAMIECSVCHAPKPEIL